MRFWQKSGRYFADTVFPPTAEQLIVRQVIGAELIQKINPGEEQGVISLLPYADPVVSALIQEAKFHYNRRAYEVLADVLASYLKDCPKPIILLPVPLSAARYRGRGYNQVTEVARRVAKKHPACEVDTDAIIRWRHTKAQTELPRDERLNNVRGAFSLRAKDSSLPHQKQLILLDDVATTGATLKAVKTTLPPKLKNSVTLLALAH